MRRRARPAPRAGARSPAITAATASACRSAARECGSVSVARHGAGTERLEHDLAQIGHEVFRLDADVARRRRAAAALRGRRRAAILVGTQMVAKGHDFPDVTLGVVVDADGTLRFPDFRAEERTFALVAQLAGRAGRGPGGGRVLVQTLAPDAPSIAAAARHDADGFLDGELARREALRYPPFSHLIRIVCSAPRAGAPSTRRRAGAARRARRHRRRAGARPGAAVSPARPRARAARRQGRRPRRARCARPAPRSTRVAGDRTRRGVALSASTSIRSSDAIYDSGASLDMPTVDDRRGSSREGRDEQSRGAAAAGSRGPRAPRRARSRTCASSATRSCDEGAPGRALRRRAARRGRAHGAAHARRARHRPRRAAGRHLAPRCSSTASSPTARSSRSSTPRSSGPAATRRSPRRAA